MRVTAAAAHAALNVVIAAAFMSACRTSSPTSHVPGLGEIMTLTQMRHSKLWFAGDAGNWPLADYELDEIEEGFEDAARFHPTHKDAPRPLTELIPEFTTLPLRDLRAAVARRDGASFVPAYDALTASCNGCHEATGFSFNVVVRPTANPYFNQQFRIER